MDVLPNFPQKERITRVIQEYDAQDWPRSGTEGDHSSAHWLAEQVTECGLDPVLEPFDLSRVDPELAYVEIEGRRVDGLPLFDGGFTTPDGVHGRIGPLDSNAEIGIAEVGGLPRQDLIQARQADRHTGIVAVTPTGPGVAILNAPSFLTPFGPPVLQLGSEDREWLAGHASRNSEARLVAAVSRTPSVSFNVTSRLDGEDSSLAPLIVMTPRSGWWHCAGERAAGIVCWLEVMRSMAEVEPKRDVVFVATSGHEIGLLGIESFLERRPGLEKDARAWVHFGANIGASSGASLGYSASDQDLMSLAEGALRDAGTRSVEPQPLGKIVGAESSLIYSRGARCVAMQGGAYSLLHREADRWPSGIDVDTVARCANAFSAIAVNLAMDGVTGP